MTLLASAMLGLVGLSLGVGALLAGGGVLTAILFSWTTLLLGIAVLSVVRGPDRRVQATALIASAPSAVSPVVAIAGSGDPSRRMTGTWVYLGLFQDARAEIASTRKSRVDVRDAHLEDVGDDACAWCATCSPRTSATMTAPSTPTLT
jgi:hypothetical protein